MNRYFTMTGLLAAALALAVWPMQAQQPQAQGKAAYDNKCAGCHGARGEGKIGPPLVPLRHDATALLGIVRQGGSDMPGIPDREITDEAVAAIGIYLRTLTPAAPGVTPAPAPPAAPAQAARPVPPGAPQPAPTHPTLRNFTPVTDAMLEQPDPNDWVNWRRTLDAWGYSPLNQINRQNAASLQLAWATAMMPGRTEATPLVYKGVMYLPNANGGVQALDAATGDLLWSYKKDIESQPPPLEPAYTWDDFSWMRNLAIFGDRIFMATHDAHILALDAKNGKVLWDTTVADYKLGYRYTAGPIVVKGKVVTGITGCERFKNGTCFITAHDPATGKELWRTSTVARPGEPGGETWSDLPLTFRAGSDLWIPGSYDPKTNLIYYSTAQAKPWARVSRRTNGDALYTNSVLALDPDTGKIVWYHQLIPGETHDEDEVFENILIDHDGQASLFKMGKLGILWEIDRKTGKFVDGHDLGYQNVGYIDRQKGQLAYKLEMIPELDKPLEWCGNVRNWPAMAYHPETQALYVPASSLGCGTSVYSLMDQVEGGGGRWYGEKTVSRRASPLNPFPNSGQFLAMDIKTGKVLWRHETRRGSSSAALTTGGGLAIIGDGDRYLYVDDAATGKTLFKTRLSGPARGFPISYAVGGRQFIAVPVSGDHNAVYVFAVPQPAAAR
jgi:alcohol dehydrogenase (cytochrome c)